MRLLPSLRAILPAISGRDGDRASRTPGITSHVNILGLRIWNPSYEAFQEWFERHALIGKDREAGQRKPALLGIVNAHTANLSLDAPSYRSALKSFDVLINDGAGMAMAARMRGSGLQYNFNGTDLFPRLFAELGRPLKVFLYGATERSSRGAAEAITQRFPQVEVVGRCIGFQRRRRPRIPGCRAEPDVVELINSSGADLVLVALGQPLQERWIVDHAPHLRVGLICGVGALFDFLSGNVPRAPKLVRQAKMEWAYRLAREPKRMFGRYVVGNPKFILRARKTRRFDQAASASH